MAKFYQVDCTINASGIMLIEAADEQNAVEIAQYLLNEGRGDIQMDTADGDATAEKATEQRMDAHDMDIAERNRLEYLEVLADNEAND